MKRLLPVLLCITALVAFAVWAPNAGANPSTGNCVGCHNFGDESSAIHSAHLNLGLPNSCNTCHGNIGDTPATPRCGTCHTARGLSNHHENAGAASCVRCHSGDPAPENSPVPGYASITAVLDPCDGSEERFNSFTVSLDNDGDGLYDMNDPDCQPPVEDCTDGVDNDGDGLIDCADQDCSTDPACQLPVNETDCADNVDNDGDGFIDCADSDCASDPACPQPEVCDDNVDNDFDGFIDCADQDCAADPVCQIPQVEDCNDGVDNDFDGFIDCADPDCANDSVCGPPPAEVCDDRVDNDGDGAIDCTDSDCTNDPLCRECTTDFECDNGLFCDGPETCIDFTCQPGTDPCAPDETCGEENGGRCVAPPEPPPAPVCGDGFIDAGEECDDANLVNGDGCSANCTLEDNTTPVIETNCDDDIDNDNDGAIDCDDSDCVADEECVDEADDDDKPTHFKGWENPRDQHQDYVEDNGPGECMACHGADLKGSGDAPSCFSCHGNEWDEGVSGESDDHESDSDRGNKGGRKWWRRRWR